MTTNRGRQGLIDKLRIIDQNVNWIDPRLLVRMKRIVPPEAFVKITDHLYEVYGVPFAFAGRSIELMDAVGFLMDHGWFSGEDKEEG